MSRRPNPVPLACAALSCALLWLTPGCSSSGPPLLEVRGKIILPSGQPLTGGSVVFHPDKAKGNEGKHAARGAVNEQGEYTLATDSLGAGALAGWYKVAVVGTKKNPKDEYGEPIWIINQAYGTPETSGLVMEVKSGGSYDIKLPK
jgi:hypothetical protein